MGQERRKGGKGKKDREEEKRRQRENGEDEGKEENSVCVWGGRCYVYVFMSVCAFSCPFKVRVITYP